MHRGPIPRLRWLPVWRRNLRVWQKLAVPSLLSHFGEPLLYLLGLGYGLGALVGEVGGLPYVVFIASGIVCSSAMVTASFEATYSAYTRMAAQRTWDAMLATPLRVRDVVLGELLWAATKGLMSATAILAVATALGAVSGPRALWVLPLAGLTALCYASLAMVVTGLARSYDFFLYWSTLFITPTLLLGGVFFPLERMPLLVQAAAHYLPLTHAVALSRPLMTGGPLDGLWLHLGVLAAASAAGAGVSGMLIARRLRA